MQPGDLILFYGADWVSRTIEAFTFGPSHVGIVAELPRVGLCLVESTTMCPWPCLVQERRVRGVQAQDIPPRIATYPGAVRRLPLVPAWSFSTAESRQLGQMLRRHWIGADYALGHALLSGTRLLKRCRCAMPYPDRGSVFCSALCAALLQRFGRMPLVNPSTVNPASLVRTLRACGVYGEPERINVPALSIVRAAA